MPKFNPIQGVALDEKYRVKVVEMLEYMCRGESVSVSGGHGDIVTFKHLPNDRIGAYGNRYDSLSVATIICYHIPMFFNLGNVTVDLSKMDNIVEMYYLEYKRRLLSEETSEEIPEIHEQATV